MSNDTKIIESPTPPNQLPAKIQLQDVNLRYFSPEGETEALSGISFSLQPGEFVSIIGQSGCGKSTLLSLIAGIFPQTNGKVLIDGELVCGAISAWYSSTSTFFRT